MSTYESLKKEIEVEKAKSQAAREADEQARAEAILARQAAEREAAQKPKAEEPPDDPRALPIEEKSKLFHQNPESLGLKSPKTY